MKFAYQYKKDDYLKALSLLSANRQRDTFLLRIFWKFAVGCAVYLATAAMRGALSVNDSVSYLAGILAFLVLLLLDSPRLLPALTFNKDLASGKIPEGVIGWHEIDAADNLITFRNPSLEHRMRYSHLVGMTAFSDGALFYLQDGSVEYLPARSVADGNGFQSALQELRQHIISGKKSPGDALPLPPFETGDVNLAQYSVSREEYLQVNALHEKFTRIFRMRNPKTLLWALVVLWIGAGSAKGILEMFRGAQPPMGIVYGYFALGLLALLLGAIVLYRPVWLVNRVLSMRLRMNQFPAGFFDQRTLQWSRDWIMQTYGKAGLKLAWPYFTDIVSDGCFMLFYQHEKLVLFIPLASVGSAAANALREEISRHRTVAAV